MKKKISKIWSIGLTFMLAVSLLLVAAPGMTVSAADPVINEWDEFAFPDPGEEGDWVWDPDIGAIGPIAEAINGDLYAYADVDVDDVASDDQLFKSTDGGRTWELTKYSDPDDGVVGGRVIDMVCSSLDADTLYVTDGNYVYKTDDAGDEWDYVARDSLEVALSGDCGLGTCGYNSHSECTLIPNCDGLLGGYFPFTTPITSIDVGYQDEDPFVFIGTRTHCSGVDLDGVGGLDIFPGSVYYLDEEGYGAEWVDMDLSCEYDLYDVLSVGCAPDFDDSDETYVVISNGVYTYVVYTDGGICEWTEFAELLWNCVDDNHFGSAYASRIAFPDDWEDSETLFVGVVDCNTCDAEDLPPIDQGGDVYSVSDGEALDRNVRPGEGGCEGDSTDIISLDFCGDTDSGSVIAGAFCDTTVYYSSDGGWEWDPSIKDPTGDMLTYVIWIGDCGESALAATAGCEAAVSLTCVSEEDDAEEVGMSWNQISLIAMDMDCVTDLDHSPGYITDSETMYWVISSDGPGECDSTNLFRNDGTYWERVFSSTTYYDDFQGEEEISAVQVSPDFLDTETVFVTNSTMDIFRSQDAGCSWDRIGYPCDPTDLYSWAVLDEDTIYVGTDGVVLMTDRGGSRSWEECVVEDADDGIEADLIVYFAFDITDDTTTILVGSQTQAISGDTDEYQVFLCEVDPDEDWEDQEWHLVGDCEDVLENGGTPYDTRTSVAFDPGYAVTDDAGENMIYAAAGEVIARCIIDWDEDWADQEWTEIYGALDKAWGMKVVGDTVLYVGDADSEDGMVRSLNPTEEDEDDIEFNRVDHYLSGSEELNLRQLTAGENGCPDSNVLWATNVGSDCDEVWFYEDTLATPVILIGPADGAQVGETDEVTLEWEAFCDAETYEIELYRYCAECPDEEEYIDLRFDDDGCFECDIDDCVGCSDETCCLFLSGYQYIEIEGDIILVPGGMLEPGETYYWSVRVCAIEGEGVNPLPMLSKWSEEQMFTTEMTAVPFGDLCSPECGSDDIIITPNFSWDDVSDATSYEVQLATNEDFDPVLASGTPTVNAWLGAPELDYGTTYYWRVRVVKDGITSEWVTCIFTTMAEPVKVYTCQQCGMEFATQAELQAHWDALHALPPPTTPAYIWVIIAVGALLVVAMLILIVRTRRVV